MMSKIFQTDQGGENSVKKEVRLNTSIHGLCFNHLYKGHSGSPPLPQRRRDVGGGERVRDPVFHREERADDQPSKHSVRPEFTDPRSYGSEAVQGNGGTPGAGDGPVHQGQ